MKVAGLVFLMSWSVWAAPAGAVRYALIIGNNTGRAPAGEAQPPLKHAEREAAELRDRLVTLGNFSGSADRTALLLGASREEILAAARRLAAQHQRDRQTLGSVPTLFAFFFTGHGLSGELLTATEPLGGSDLASIFNEMGATFTVGVFDACFSGSLNLKTLTAKGLKLTPGFNAFETLPIETLNAAGTMWFVSSQPDQVSYEDERLGGVFTHFFMEAMERAPANGYGLSLEEIWEYTRTKTQHYTSGAARPQTPQQFVRNLTSSGPLYFSFPTKRSASIAFDSKVSGRFLLRYENGQLSELVTKERGLELKVPVYPAGLVLERVDGGGQQRLLLGPGEQVVVREGSTWAPSGAPGSQHVELATKGNRLDGLVVTHEESRFTGLVDATYQLAFGVEGRAWHSARAGARVDFGLLQARVGYSYAQAGQAFPAWSYVSRRHGLELEGGLAASVGKVRLGPVVGLAVGFDSTIYDDGSTRHDTALLLKAGASALWQIVPARLYVTARAAMAFERARPAARAASVAWSLVPELGLGIGVQLF